MAVAVLLAAAAVRALNHDPEGYMYHDHSLTRPYDQSHDLSHWEYFGSTLISNNFIRLTPDRQSRRGSLWNKKAFHPPPTSPVPTQYPPWELVVEFSVHGVGKKLFGDGFALWYTKERAQEGSVFGNIEKFTGLGIFFDTYSNMQQGHGQYISVMVNDGTQAYDHSKDGGDAKLAGCPIDFRGKEKPVFARIVYQDTLLRAYIDAGQGEWQECFVVRSVHLPNDYYFGFTAATGDLADNHDILSVKLAEPLPMDPAVREDIERRIAEDIRDKVEQQPHRDPQYDPAQQPSPADEMPAYLVVLAVLIVVGVAAAVIYLAAREQRRANTHFT